MFGSRRQRTTLVAAAAMIVLLATTSKSWAGQRFSRRGRNRGRTNTAAIVAGGLAAASVIVNQIAGQSRYRHRPVFHVSQSRSRYRVAPYRRASVYRRYQPQTTYRRRVRRARYRRSGSQGRTVVIVIR